MLHTAITLWCDAPDCQVHVVGEMRHRAPGLSEMLGMGGSCGDVFGPPGWVFNHFGKVYCPQHASLGAELGPAKRMLVEAAGQLVGEKKP